MVFNTTTTLELLIPHSKKRQSAQTGLHVCTTPAIFILFKRSFLIDFQQDFVLEAITPIYCSIIIFKHTALGNFSIV